MSLVVRTYGLELAWRRTASRLRMRELYRRMMKVGHRAERRPGLARRRCSRRSPAALVLVLWWSRWSRQGQLSTAEDLWVFWVYIGMLTFPTVMLGYRRSRSLQRGLAALQPARRESSTPCRRSRDRGRRRSGRSESTGRSPRSRRGSASLTTPERPRSRLLSRRFPSRSPSRDRPSESWDRLARARRTLVNLIPRGCSRSSGSASFSTPRADRRLARRRGRSAPPAGWSAAQRASRWCRRTAFSSRRLVAENIRFGRPDASSGGGPPARRLSAHVLRRHRGVLRERLRHGGRRTRDHALRRPASARCDRAGDDPAIPAILILDDSLSSVDHETEEAILK